MNAGRRGAWLIDSRWARACSAGTLAALLLFPGGCETTQETEPPAGSVSAAAEQGPPPEGYETWEDYWKAKDKDYRDFEHDMKIKEMRRPVVPGARY